MLSLENINMHVCIYSVQMLRSSYIYIYMYIKYVYIIIT